MKDKLRSAMILALTVIVLLFTSNRLPADTGTCGGAMTTVPFTDVMASPFFCQIAEAFFSGLTNGTTPTTYSPNDFVPREQMAAFITRTHDSALRRGSLRAVLGQWAFPAAPYLQSQGVSINGPARVQSDGQDLWITAFDGGSVLHMRNDGSVVNTIDGIGHPFGVIVVGARVFVSSDFGGVCEVTTGILNCNWPAGTGAQSIATDGTYLWTANRSASSLSKIDPSVNGSSTTINGFSTPVGILFDGSNLWVNDLGDGTLKKLDAGGNIIQNVSLNGGADGFPVYDGSNIWIPDFSSNSVAVVRARDGLMLTRLTGNGLSGPVQAAFDGERILITSFVGHRVSLWKATDLTPIANFSTGQWSPDGACSDGAHFWVALYNTNALPGRLARF
jgi:hypothetical protein